MGIGFVGVLRVDLHLPGGGSVTGRGRGIRGVRTRPARDVSAGGADVDHHDLRQRARLSPTLVACDADEAAAGGESR